MRFKPSSIDTGLSLMIRIIGLIFIIIPFIRLERILLQIPIIDSSKIPSKIDSNSYFFFFLLGLIIFSSSYAIGRKFARIKEFDLSEICVRFYSKYKDQLIAYMVAFVTIILIYGSKLAFKTYSSDDYSILNTTYSIHTIGHIGRWFLPFFNSVFYDNWASINPYFNTFTSLFAISLAALFSTLMWNINSRFLTVVIIIICSASPFFASNIYYNLNTSVHIGFLMASIGTYLLTKGTKFYPISFVLLVLSIGLYQISLQLSLMITIVWYILELVAIETKKDILSLTKKGILFIVIIIAAFFVSGIIGDIILKHFDITTSSRYLESKEVGFFELVKNSLNILEFIPIIRVNYIPVQYNLMTFTYLLLGFLSFHITSRGKDNSVLKTAIFLFVLIISFYTIKLPLIYGMEIPLRAFIHMSWFISLFVILLYKSNIKILKSSAIVLSITTIIISFAGISAYFNAAAKRTESDMIRIKEVVNNIRQHEDFAFDVDETIEFLIVGEKDFKIKEERGTDLFAYSWAKYHGFSNFSDLKFTTLTEEKTENIINKLQAYSIEEYPNKGSIQIIDNTVVLILDKSKVKSELE